MCVIERCFATNDTRFGFSDTLDLHKFSFLVLDMSLSLHYTVVSHAKRMLTMHTDTNK